MAKYLQTANWIVNQIREMQLRENDKIAPELHISETLGVSRQTVRKAIRHLESQGILNSIQGSGTYVTQVPTTAPGFFSTSKTVAVITTYMNSYIFPYKINGIYEVLSANGYMMNLLATNNSIENEDYLLSTLLDGDFAGIIIEPSRSTLPRIRPELFEQLSQKYPLVLIDSCYRDISLPSIRLDDARGGYVATSHLLEQGHREIVYIGKMDDMQGIKRYQGYLKALVEYQLDCRKMEVLWYTNDTSPDRFLETQEERLLSCIGKHSAVFCYNDLIASALVNFLQAHQIDIPNDISVVSYDDSPLAVQNIPLTTVMYPRDELGQKAASNLLQLTTDPTFDASYRFAPELIQRSSVKNLK